MAKQSRPVGVKFVVILEILTGAILALFGFVGFTMNSRGFLALNPIALLTGPVVVLVGFGAWKGMIWAWFGSLASTLFWSRLWSFAASVDISGALCWGRRNERAQQSQSRCLRNSRSITSYKTVCSGKL